MTSDNDKLRRDEIWQGRWQHTSLLPNNSTAMERRVEGAMALLEAVPLPHRALWGPNLCPEHLLPWLAWALSVDIWDGDWPVKTKRAVLSASFARHRIKGTKAAVLQALADHRIVPGIIEWFEQNPKGKPYTFDVELDAAQSVLGVQPVLSLEMLRLVNELVLATKSLRSLFAIQVSARFENGIGLATGSGIAAVTRNSTRPTWITPPLRSQLVTKVGFSKRVVSRTNARVFQEALRLNANAQLGGASVVGHQIKRQAIQIALRKPKFAARVQLAAEMVPTTQILRRTVRPMIGVVPLAGRTQAVSAFSATGVARP